MNFDRTVSGKKVLLSHGPSGLILGYVIGEPSVLLAWNSDGSLATPGATDLQKENLRLHAAD
jgi:hypothetical protein